MIKGHHECFLVTFSSTLPFVWVGRFYPESFTGGNCNYSFIMTNSEQVPDLSEHKDEEITTEEMSDVAGGAKRVSKSSMKLGGIGTLGTAGRTKITTDEVGDVDQ